MRRTQLIALLLVTIMAVATIPAVAVAVSEVKPAPAAHQTSLVSGYPLKPARLTVASSPQYPYRGQTYTIYGYLSCTYCGQPLKEHYLYVYYRFSTQSPWTYWKTVRTNFNGYYSFPQSSGARYVYWRIVFPGDPAHYMAPTYAYKTVYPGYSSTSIYSTNYDPAPYGPFTLYGYVKRGSGIYQYGLANSPVRIFGRVAGSTTWNYIATTYTSTSGYYHVHMTGARGTVQYTALFLGYPYGGSTSYWNSQSRVINVYA